MIVVAIIGEDRIVLFIADQYNVADLHRVVPVMLCLT